ncbi:Talin-1 [Balamuthia mandrillaris]
MAAKGVVRVHFLDNSMSGFAVERKDSVVTLKEKVCNKLGLGEQHWDLFSLFERVEADGYRHLEFHESPLLIQEGWGESVSSPSAAASPSSRAFVFKQHMFLDSREGDLLCDPVGLNLIYMQHQHQIKNSHLTVTPEVAVRLAGLQMHIVYSDHSAVHKPGFLTDKINEYIPHHLLPTKRAAIWDALILEEHKKHVGKSDSEAKLQYIATVKKCDYHHVTFFPPCTMKRKGGSSSNSGSMSSMSMGSSASLAASGARKLSKKVVLGVDENNIYVFHTNKKKEKLLFMRVPFTEIIKWSSSPTAFAFEATTSASPVNAQAGDTYVFITRFGGSVAWLIQSYVDYLVDMLTASEDETTSRTFTGTTDPALTANEFSEEEETDSSGSEDDDSEVFF